MVLYLSASPKVLNTLRQLGIKTLLNDSDIGGWRQRSTLSFLPIASCRDN
ncbi:hypothetical protein [Pseudanabaena sp. UWO310]|nr:hypothetical protein [Pseudanabaena sp. UWO310]